MIDASANSFQRDVIEASHDVPVLVDFWAPWCGPCRALGPMLERLEQSSAGRFRVVKINSDDNPELSARFGVRSIPFVVAFVDGRPIDSFVGVLPEPQLRAFIERIVPNPSELERRKAAQLAAAGDTASAVTALRAALALDPANDEARLDLADLLMNAATRQRDAQALEEIRGLLGEVAPLTQQSQRFGTLRTAAGSLARAAEVAPEGVLRQRIAAAPVDLQARLDLANLMISQRRFEPALDELLEIVARDRSFGDDAARKTVLAIFEMLAERPDVVAAYRRKLAATLNR